MNTYRYSAPTRCWHDFPDVEAIMDELAEHALEQSSLEQAMQKLLKQGVRHKYGDSLDGLDELAAQSRNLRQRLLDEYTMEPLIEQLLRQINSLISRELETLRERTASEEKSYCERAEEFLQKSSEVIERLEQMRNGRRRATPQACAKLEKKFEELFLQQQRLDAEMRAFRMEETRRLASLQQIPGNPGRALQKLKGYQPIDVQVGETLAGMTELADKIAAIERAQMQPGFSGQKSLGLDDAMALVERLLRMERLESRLRKGILTPADQALLNDLLGPDVLDRMDALTCMKNVLLQAGYLEQDGESLRLSPRAVRRIGQKALSDIFSNLHKGGLGGHETSFKGSGQPDMCNTKIYGFGDSFNIHLGRTLMNALRHEAAGIPLRISPSDFEVYSEQRSAECSNVLMLDLSYTMAQNRKLQSAKRVIFALDNLIRTRYPKDTLHIVGFATYARELTTEELPDVNLTLGNPFTNIQDGLRLSEELISRDRGRNRQIILITDGEPTAFCRDGDLYVDYPPTPEIFVETMKEVARLTRKGIVINTFMLDERPHLIEFVEQMTRLNKGRAFFSTPGRLGEYLLVDYIARRRRLIK